MNTFLLEGPGGIPGLKQIPSGGSGCFNRTIHGVELILSMVQLYLTVL